MTPKNSYPLAPEKKVIKREQMSGYQKRLMADLNLDLSNSKTLKLTLRVTLRDALQKKQFDKLLRIHSFHVLNNIVW